MENDDDERRRRIKEEYEIWKQNSRCWYDMVITHHLECPSLTVEWLPDGHEPSGKMILGTHTSEDELNYLMIAQVLLPSEDADIDARYYDDEMPEDCDFGCTNNNKVKIIQKIQHEGEVYRARCMPQNPLIIATKAVSGAVYVFDYSRHPSEPPSYGACNPDLRLRGHNKEGFGLSWSKLKQGHLLSGSDDAQICLWDINATPHDKALQAMQKFKFQDEGAVEDVEWHLSDENLFGSVGDDRCLHIWDVRSDTANKPVKSVLAHQREVYLKHNSARRLGFELVLCLDFNPLNERFVATGSRDNTVKLFDLRMFHTALHTFDGHKDAVVQVGWKPENENILASACHGRRLMVWDRSRIGEEQTAENGPPELLFTHEGHTSKISDFSWNPNEEWVVASVAADKILQIWKRKL